MYCTDHLVDVISDDIYAQTRIFNLVGEKGVGKSHMVAELMEERRKRGAPCGYLDFEEYKGVGKHTTLNALYQICDYLTIKHGMALTKFEIVDEVNSERWGKIPYCQRKKEVVASAIDQASDLSELVVDVISEFRDLPYVGVGISLFQRASKLAYAVYHSHSPAYQSYKEFRTACRNMSDSELMQQLPLSLASDVEREAKGDCLGHSILVVVDNVPAESIHYGWLDALISHTEHVTWVFVSHTPIHYTNCPVVTIPIQPMDKEQLKIYLEGKQKGWTECVVDVLFRISHGLPLRVERMLEYAAQKGGEREIDWEQMEKLGYQSIARESLNGLSLHEKEILFQLNFAQSFDEDLFSRMFPGRLFGLYRNWFRSSLFSEMEPGRYKVQPALKEEIAAYMRQLDGDLERVCREKLYRAEYAWFQELDVSSPCDMSQCDYHLRNLLAYGMDQPSPDGYARDLIGLRGILLELGYTTEYCDTLAGLADRVDKSVRIAVYREMAMIYLGISQFEKSRGAIQQGMKLLKQHDAENWITFSFILMELEYISPSDEQNAVQHCVDIAEQLLDVLKKNMEKIPFKHYINSMVKTHLYLAKAYIVKNEYEKGASHAQYVLDLCAKPELCSALALHASYAKAQEYMGEIHSMKGEQEAALNCYRSAVKNYGVAEVVQPYWDASFCLNVGMIYKRMGEACLDLAKEQSERERRGDLEAEALTSMDHAWKKYKEVRTKHPELADTYCKIGFACNTLLEYFWSTDDHGADVEKYLEQGHENLQMAFQMLGGSQTNRELANIACTLNRLEGCYFARIGQDARAQEAFAQSETWGRTAISVAPRHPYGYLVLAECCLALGRFLQDEGKQTDGILTLQEGLKQIRIAKEYAGNSNRHFQSVEDQLLCRLNG